MAIKITDSCIHCGAGEPERPNGAIYPNGVEWKIADKTRGHGIYVLADGATLYADSAQPPLSNEYYYIVNDKCTECKGIFDEPQCAPVCPVDGCIADEMMVETDEQLLAKTEKISFVVLKSKE
ncbi:MAG: ferredoxin [Chitinophagales bacterium]|nr:ferredoxin [Chitinophagales bacterium]